MRRNCTLISAPGSRFPRARLQPPCPGKGYADVVASARGLQALAAKAVISLPAPEKDGFSWPSFTNHSVGSSDTCWDWDCTVGSSHRRAFAVTRPTENLCSRRSHRPSLTRTSEVVGRDLKNPYYS